MKVNGRALASVLAMVVTFIFVMDFQVEAAQYLGQVTWTWHKTRDEKGPTDKYETITVGLFFLGGSSYQLVGGGNDPESGAQYGGGTAMLVGNNLIMNLTWSRDRTDGRQDVAIFKGQVDKTTFNGTGWNIKKRFDPTLPPPTNQFVDKYGAGTLTLVGNPPPLGPAQVAPLQLLMDNK
jgi:hypothetical protein